MRKKNKNTSISNQLFCSCSCCFISKEKEQDSSTMSVRKRRRLVTNHNNGATIIVLLLFTLLLIGFAQPLWRQACIALICTALLFAIWLPHILRAVLEELKKRRAENATAFDQQFAFNSTSTNNFLKQRNATTAWAPQTTSLSWNFNDSITSTKAFTTTPLITTLPPLTKPPPKTTTTRSTTRRSTTTRTSTTSTASTTSTTSTTTTSTSTTSTTTTSTPTTTGTTKAASSTTSFFTTLPSTTETEEAIAAKLLWFVNTTTSAIVTTTSTVANAVSTVALPLAVVSTLAPLTTSPVAGYTMSEDTEYLPKMLHTPATSRLTIAKLALALNRINNIPLKWCTPETEERYNFNCHRAVRNVGDIRILQRTIMDVVTGRKEKVMFGAVGGSVTAGHDVKHHQLYVNRIASVFSRALDVPTVTQVGALSATGSEFFAYCLHKMFEMRRLDIIAVEFCINDDRFKDFMPGYHPDRGRPMEELVRQILQYDNIQPVLVCFRQVKTLVPLRPDESNLDADCQSIEDTDFLPLAAYYALPLISWKKVFCRSELRRNMSLFVAPDGVHPTALVHEQIGEFFSLLLKYAIEDLIGKLLSRYPSYAQPWNLPRPFTMETAPGLYPSTWLQFRPMCFINFERRDSGFETKSLLKAVTHSSNATLIGTSGPLNEGDVLEYYEMTGQNATATFAFQFDNPKRPDLSLVMSLVYSTMASCNRDSFLRITVSAKPALFFTAANNRRQKILISRALGNATQIVMPIKCFPDYHANMVDEIPFGSQFGHVNELINRHGNLILTLEKVEKYYPVYLHAIVAGWRRTRELQPVF